MSTSNLNRKKIVVDDGKDSIVIVSCLGDIPGGLTLDVSDVAADVEVIKAGHVLIQDNETKAVKPLGVSNGAYVSLPAKHSYLGVLKGSVLKSDPRSAILTIGQVNAAASPYPVTEAIRTGLLHIQFIN